MLYGITFFAILAKKNYKLIMRRILTVIMCVLSLTCFSQNEGYLNIEQDQRIEQLIQRQRKIHNNDNKSHRDLVRNFLLLTKVRMSIRECRLESQLQRVLRK